MTAKTAASPEAMMTNIIRLAATVFLANHAIARFMTRPRRRFGLACRR